MLPFIILSILQVVLLETNLPFKYQPTKFSIVPVNLNSTVEVEDEISADDFNSS